MCTMTSACCLENGTVEPFFCNNNTTRKNDGQDDQDCDLIAGRDGIFGVDSAVNHLPTTKKKKKKKKMRKQTSSKCTSSSDYMDTLLDAHSSARSSVANKMEKKKKKKKKNTEKIMVQGMTSTKESKIENEYQTVNIEYNREQKTSNNIDSAKNKSSEWQQQANEPLNKTDISPNNNNTTSSSNGRRIFKRIWKRLTSKIKKNKRNFPEEEEEEIVFSEDINTIISEQQPRSRPLLLRTLSNHSCNTIPLDDIDSKVLKRISSRDLVRSIRSAQSKRKLSDENKENEICFLKESARRFDNNIDSKDQKKRNSRTTNFSSTLQISPSSSRTSTPPRRRDTHTVSPRKPIRRSRRRVGDGDSTTTPDEAVTPLLSPSKSSLRKSSMRSRLRLRVGDCDGTIPADAATSPLFSPSKSSRSLCRKSKKQQLLLSAMSSTDHHQLDTIKKQYNQIKKVVIVDKWEDEIEIEDEIASTSTQRRRRSSSSSYFQSIEKSTKNRIDCLLLNCLTIITPKPTKTQIKIDSTLSTVQSYSDHDDEEVIFYQMQD